MERTFCHHSCSEHWGHLWACKKSFSIVTIGCCGYVEDRDYIAHAQCLLNAHCTLLVLMHVPQCSCKGCLMLAQCSLYFAQCPLYIP